MKAPRHQQAFSVRLVASLCALCLVLFQAQISFAQTRTITVQVDRPGGAIPKTLFGLFFEDINFGADGGLYPERVKNRSFEFPNPMMGWKPIERGGSKGALQVYDLTTASDAPNSHYLRLKAETPGEGFGVSNEGFRGVGVEKGAEYIFSVTARRVEGTPAALRVEIEDAQGRQIGTAKVSDFTSDWKKYTATVRATETNPKARVNILLDGTGALDVDMVSLFPKETWGNRENGLRADLVKLLKEMKPGFLRFPGGCIVEGRYLEQRYQWKTTIGEPEDRKLIVNRWNTEFNWRPTPDYYQSFGLGYYEYFQLSEDIGAEPLPIMNCGMACQFNSGELAPLEDLDTYIQDALDLIEFANGAVTTPWGKKRAAMGHPAPFNLKMIGVGNEQWGPQYVERYREFARALKAKHPEIQLVGAAGPSPDDERFHFLWGKMRELKADLVDEHFYMAPKWFRDNVGRYDNYPRTGPKVFAGEYAAQSVGIASPDNKNNWETAVSEAAFITGIERNADVVHMSSYAPLFGHVEAWQWTPNMIWFDNLRSYGTPNYYVQKTFSVHKGTQILPVLLDGSEKNGQSNLFTSASFDAPTNEVVLKVVNTAPTQSEVRISLAGARRLGKQGKVYVLTAPDLKAENSLDEPTKVSPVEKPLAVPSGDFTYTFAPNSLTVIRVGVGGQQARH
ncbi:MAG TPA: alpha-L-arabinofuranosidase C-terminal domain-containing protein [Pyrinomonadaceae bacterium]|nr:alpha-L-arabinofuranosidase C-terminal domain-containing protein [Pyrinomonadaceae bacterium]